MSTMTDQHKPNPVGSDAVVVATASAAVNSSGEYQYPDASGKRYVCPICNHSFTRKHNLKSHQLIHTDERPFGCSTCRRRFRRMHDLRRHQKLHTNEKPFECPRCGKKFARADALLRHEKSSSGCPGHKFEEGPEPKKQKREPSETPPVTPDSTLASSTVPSPPTTSTTDKSALELLEDSPPADVSAKLELYKVIAQLKGKVKSLESTVAELRTDKQK